MEVPVGYPYGELHLGHLLESGMFEIFRKLSNNRVFRVIAAVPRKAVRE
jgi:hypothetical protein